MVSKINLVWGVFIANMLLPLSADTVWQESFETDGSNTRYSVSEVCNDNNGDFFTRTDSSDIGSYYVVNGQDGSYFYAAMDTDGTPCTLANQSISFEPIDISNQSNIVFKGLFAEDDDGDTNQDWDADASVVVEAKVDSGDWQKILQFSSTGATNTEPGLDADFDGVQDGTTALTATLSEFSASIPSTGTTLVLRILINKLDAGDEDIAFDNFRIEAETAGPPTAGLSLTNTSLNISEDGLIDSYAIALKTVPTDPVTITIATLDGESEVSDDNSTFASTIEIVLTDTNATTVYVSAVDDNDAENAHTGIITHTARSNDADYNATSIKNLTVAITDNDFSFTKIHDIQGSGSESNAGTFSVQAIVTAVYPGLNGYYIQEEDVDVDADPLTSEGIFVYDSSSVSTVSVGDLVQFTATSAEYYGNTQLSTVQQFSIVSSDNALPLSTPISLPTNWEAVEGMLVTLTQKMTVTEHYNLGQYGEIMLSSDGKLYQFTHDNTPDATGYTNHLANNDLKTILLDDGQTASNPDPVIFPAPSLSASNSVRGGDSITNLTGVITYSYSKYRIVPTGDVTFVKENPRPTVMPVVQGSLKVATLNVLNYFLSMGKTCGASTTLDCRGADNVDELNRQREKLLKALEKMDADIIGLVELENTPNVHVIQDIVDGLNALVGAGTYAAVDTGVIGTDAIKVGLMYKTATVNTVGSFAILDSSIDANFIDTKNRPALAQTFEEIRSGERLTTIVNHFKSKGSSCDALDDPNNNDGQGNCAQTRTKAATALATWLATDPTDSGDSDMLILGDLNSYPMEDPITALKDSGYVDLARSYIGSHAYSYVYGGEWSYLDYALASTSLASQVTDTVEWHINSDEPRVHDYNTEYNLAEFYANDEFRVSDHDPVIVGLDLGSTTGSKSTSPSILFYLLN